MEREIRAAEARSSSPITIAQPTRLAITTAFNYADNELVTTEPRQVYYQLRLDPDDSSNKQLVRLKDSSLPIGLTDEWAADKWQVLVEHVVNKASEPVFQYTYYDSQGDLQRAPSVTGQNIYRILTIDVRLKVDQNPGKSPDFLDVRTTIQPRNMRPT